MRDALQRAWLHRGVPAVLLLPAAGAFALLAAIRRRFYAAGLLARRRMPVPVVIVGNVVAGGAGKTPVVIALLEHLRRRGLRAGLVSRGYGRRGTGWREVSAGDDPADAGDEPLLAARRCGVPVFVGARRAEAAAALLAAHPATQVLVSDDGLQHYALDRDVEVCVFDDRGTGNGWLLPAGPLREPWPRRCDLVLRPANVLHIAGYSVERRLADHALRADGAMVPLAELRGRPLHAVAGIAKPGEFFRMLRAAGLELASATALPDHHGFAEAPAWGARELVCTEKDAVKLWRQRPDAWAVPLDVQVEPAFWDALDRLVQAKLSSPHGSQTA